MSSNNNIEHIESDDQDVSVRFFSVEWLEEGQIAVERYDGITLLGTPDKVLPLLKPVR